MKWGSSWKKTDWTEYQVNLSVLGWHQPIVIVNMAQKYLRRRANLAGLSTGLREAGRAALMPQLGDELPAFSCGSVESLDLNWGMPRELAQFNDIVDPNHCLSIPFAVGQ